jgi:hypothetical protein
VFLQVQLVQIRTPENRRYGPSACTLVGRENEAEDIDTLPLRVQWTVPGAKAVSEVSDFGHISVHSLEAVSLATRPAQGHGQRGPVAVE